MNILITNIGRRDYLVEYLKATEGFCDKVFVSDCNNTAPGLYCNHDGAFILPKPIDNEEIYINVLIDTCKTHDISMVIPVIDPEIYILSKYISTFEKVGIRVIVSDKNVLDICYNKLEMNHFLETAGFDIPQTFLSKEAFFTAYEKGLVAFPVIIKPVYGSGSIETFKLDSREKVDALYKDGMIIQEVIEGVEYGIDVLNNFNFEPVRCVVKRKLAMRSGETDKSITVKDQIIKDMALTLARKLKHIGNLDCDLLVSNGKYYFIDLNPRFGGGYPATHATGINYLKLLIDMVVGKEVVPEFDNYISNLMIMKTIKIYATQMEE